MTDLTTSYLGLVLDHPIVASSSPLTGDIDHLLDLQANGAAAVVLPSLFEEQVEHEAVALEATYEWASGMNAEAHGGYFPELDDYNTGAERYLDLLDRAKAELNVPVIASLNGTSVGGWTHYAEVLQEHGADALELNVYYVAADVELSGADIERQYLDLVEQVRTRIDLPLAVKVGPFFSSPGNFARQLAAAGADGLVLFNRFYQPDVDLEELTVAPDLVLSAPAEMRLVLRWIAILRGRVDAHLAATTGVHGADDVVKLVLAGADVTMMASALLRDGTSHLRAVRDGVSGWFSERDYESLGQARGSLSQASVADPDAFERANYMKTLLSYRPPV
ncbi:MAG: dihydroorotate dehydrogenase-like protein [Acidimicrobiia bacterium]|nr:dihydroorotate dehydrogenase-like protein [Acidimicrobiia bacterium]